ncbi:MAG: hypothetical protein QXD66_03190 [Candidatus Nezhaarchaeales archaeon]|nr:MAG: hypothetical protein DSO06_02435 [Candidatus Nezhaarchaeota archaeon WYZ-LMO8]
MTLPREAIAAFNLEVAGKFLATVSEDWKPNVVPVLSMRAYDEETLVFGEFMMLKTRRSLIKGCVVCACVITEKLENYVVKGVFEGFERTGEYYDFIAQIPMFRYNAYMGPRAAGIIRVEDVWQVDESRSKLNVLLDTLIARFASTQEDGKRLPPIIAEKFNRINAIKVLAKVYNGYPIILPALSMRVSSKGTKLIFGTRSTEASRLSVGDSVAAAVLTTDAIAYQVKGIYEGELRKLFGKVGVVRVDEAYTLTPPRPGEKIPL